MKHILGGVLGVLLCGSANAGLVEMKGTTLGGLIGSGNKVVVAVIPTSATAGADMRSLNTQIWIYRDGAMWVCDYKPADKQESHCQEAE